MTRISDAYRSQLVDEHGRLGAQIRDMEAAIERGIPIDRTAYLRARFRDILVCNTLNADSERRAAESAPQADA